MEAWFVLYDLIEGRPQFSKRTVVKSEALHHFQSHCGGRKPDSGAVRIITDKGERTADSLEDIVDA